MAVASYQYSENCCWEALVSSEKRTYLLIQLCLVEGTQIWLIVYRMTTIFLSSN